MIECLWCHHLERSTESCSTAKLSLKSLHSAPRWAPASCQCPVKWLMTADWDMWKIWENIHTIWHSCEHRDIYSHTSGTNTYFEREQDKQSYKMSMQNRSQCRLQTTCTYYMPCRSCISHRHFPLCCYFKVQTSIYKNISFHSTDYQTEKVYMHYFWKAFISGCLI